MPVFVSSFSPSSGTNPEMVQALVVLDDIAAPARDVGRVAVRGHLSAGPRRQFDQLAGLTRPACREKKNNTDCQTE